MTGAAGVCVLGGGWGNVLAAEADQPVVTIKPKVYPRALRNSLKGFRPNLAPRVFEDVFATLARHYIKWNEIENAESDGIERIRVFCNEQWKGVEAANIKVIPRVYLHWSKANQKFWPADMTADDYSSEQFKRRIARLVARLGECWDKDPRVAFIQMGIIGKWGEHHSPSVSPEMQKILGDAFTLAFPNKKVTVRHPWDFKDYAFGIYWDSFAHPQQMKTHGAGIEQISPRWKTAPIGGETAYDWGNFKEQLGANPDDTLSNPARRRYLTDCIYRLHANNLGWIANYDASKPLVREGAEEVQRAFGYRWVIDEVNYPAQIAPSQPFAVSFSVRNLGSSPLYYNWPVEVSLLDPKTRAVLWAGIFKDVDTRLWLPGDDWDSAAGAYAVKPKPVRVEGRFTVPPAVGTGERLLALAVLDPAGNLPGARFSIANYFTGGRHPIGRIGVGMLPAAAELDPTTFDDPGQDRTLRYMLPEGR